MSIHHTVLQFSSVQSLSHVRLFVTPWTVARQAPLSVGLPRQEYWSGLPVPPLGDLPEPGIKPLFPVSPALQADSLPLCHLGNPCLPGCLTGLQACKPTRCPALRRKKAPGYSHRDINGLSDRGSYTSETTPHCEHRQGVAAILATRGRRLPFIGKLTSGWLITRETSG